MNRVSGQSIISHVPRKKIHYFRNSLLSWFNKNGRNFTWRKKSATNFELIIAEVLLQRTRAETVEMFFKQFIKKYPSWRALSMASEKSLGKFLRPIGLWKRRAASLRLLARTMVNRRGRFPRSREDIEALPGVGQYIANAVLLFCHGEPQPLLDVNMARVLERVFGARKLADIRYDPYLQQLPLEIISCKKTKELNWAILDLAALICTIKEPHCHECPVISLCVTSAKNRLTNSTTSF